MRYFGLYFAFFCFVFSYIFKADISEAVAFGVNMLFSYFVLTTAISLSIALILFLALKRGLNFAFMSPFFGGLLKGAAGLFFLKFLANRSVLLLGSYLLVLSVSSLDLYMALVGAIFLAFGYLLFHPFDFDFNGEFTSKKDPFCTATQNDTNTVDVEVIDHFDRLEKR